MTTKVLYFCLIQALWELNVKAKVSVDTPVALMVEDMKLVREDGVGKSLI